MIDLSYTLSPILKKRIEEIEDLRKEILLHPLSLKEQARLRWETTIDKIHSSLSISDIAVEKKQIAKTISLQLSLKKGDNLKNLSDREKLIIGYKKTLDVIQRDWLVTSKNVTVKDILMLYDMVSSGRTIVPISRIQELLDYLQAHKENPIIQAGVSMIGLERIRPFSQDNSFIARLLSYVFLYKNGYDVNGLIQIEKSWSSEKDIFEEALGIAINASAITIWLEFFAGSLSKNLLEIFEKIKEKKVDNIGYDSSSVSLNDRQKEIITLLEEPNTNISNKKVQKYFKISQITASRDLSKLATLGYIYQRGKGRSVYYTKY